MSKSRARSGAVTMPHKTPVAPMTLLAAANPNFVLSAYPLTREITEKIELVSGQSATALTVGSLRQLGFLGMFKYLITLRADTVYVAVPNDEDLALLPVLKLIASMINPRTLAVIGINLQPVPVSRIEAFLAIQQLFRASLRSLLYLRLARKEVHALMGEVRDQPQVPERDDVLYLNANLWFGVKAGGSVGHISGVVNGLLEARYPVTFVSAGGRLMVRETARYIQLDPPSQFGMPWEYNYFRFHFDVVDQTARLMQAQGAGFIYQRLSLCNYSGVQLSRRFRVPLILEYNGSEVWVAKNWGKPLRSHALAEKIEQVNLRHAHLIVTISDVLRDELLARGVPAERIVTYPNCIDPEIFDPSRFTQQQIIAVRQLHGIAPDALVVTFVGTFGQWHGAPVLAAAVRQILDERAAWAEARKLHFLFVGDGIKMPEVREILGCHVNSPRVTLAGLVPQKQAPLYLAASDILSSPHVPNADGSRFFGSPTKLFEYMAMDRPILASDLDQIGEVLAGSLRVGQLPGASQPPSDTPTAVLATPGSADEIVKAIEFLAERPDWRQALGRNARKVALERYTWQNHVAAIVRQARHLGLLGFRSSGPGA